MSHAYGAGPGDAFFLLPGWVFPVASLEVYTFPPPVSPAAVPEPSSVAFIGVCVLASGPAHRRRRAGIGR